MRIVNRWGMERRLSWGSLVLVLLSVLIASFADSVLEGQDSRRLTPSTKIGCSYRDGRYEHGELVQTPEPCLNCTCTRGVLVCYLRVCPTLVPPSSDCFAIKEADDCCATMICNSIHRAKNASIAVKAHFHGRTLTNNLSVYKKAEVVHILNNHRASTDPPVITTKIESTEEFSNSESAKNVSTSDSLLFVSSTPTPFEKDFDVLLNSITGCYVNGTIYAEGSAMISSSFCEYCYCIRGKQMCVRPKCHLSIEGCRPRYFSQYTCCPTRYMCNEKRKIYRITSPSTTTTTTTTTTTAQPTTLFASTVQPSGCFMAGISYSVGDPIPSTAHCRTCYCSQRGVVCTSVTCSPAMEGCEPVIPEGHCCPLEFKCNFTQTPPSDVQESTIEMNKEHNSLANNDSAEISATTPYVSNAYKTMAETKELRRTTLSVEPETAIDSSILSPAIMRENDRVIYFPEFAGNLRRRISEVASLVGYNTKQSNKGPFHSFRPPIVYKRNNERGTYFSKQGEGLIPRRAAGRGRAEFGPRDVDIVETDTEILAASSNLHISNAEYVTRGISTENQFSVEESTSALEDSLNESAKISDVSSNFRQTSSNANVFESEETTKNIAFATPTTVTLDDDISATMDLLEGLRNSSQNPKLPKSKPQTVFSHTPFSTGITFQTPDNNVTVLSAPKEDYNHSQTEIDSKTEVNSDITNESSTVALLLQDVNNATELPLSEVPFDTRSPLSDDSDHSTNFSVLNEGAVDSALTEDHSNLSSLSLDSGSSTHSVINNTMEFTLAEHHPRLSDDNISITSILTEGTNLTTDTTLTSSVQNNLNTNETRTEVSKAIWYSEPGLTTLSSHDDRTLPSSKLDNKKRPRQKDEKPHFANNMRIIPFLAKDAITNRPYGRPTRNRTQPGTQSSVEVIIGHCIVNGRVYINGEMIASSDPCSLCRCFYGKALCQKQHCPRPPSPDCFPEQLIDFCCPRYVCGKGLTEAPTLPPIPTSTENQITTQEELRWQVLSTETPLQVMHEAEEGVKTDSIPLVTSSTSRYIEPTTEAEEEHIQTNKNYPLTFDLDNISPVTSTSPTVVPITTTTQSEITEDHSNKEWLSTTESSESHSEDIKNEFWALLRVSGCNIYGEYYQLNERVTQLSGECKDCICTKDGVKCTDIC